VFLFDLEFRPTPAGARDENYPGTVSGFLGSLYRNGQLAREWHLLRLDPGYVARGSAYSEDSLDHRYYSPCVWENHLKVAARSLEAPRILPLGWVIEESLGCRCAAPSHYILFTTFLSASSPVRCGDCFRGLPLCQLPRAGREPDYHSLLSWEAAYRACDTLWMGSGAGEHFGYRQMSALKSRLTEDGRRICRELSIRSGRPFYYFLHRYYLPEPYRCPDCGGDWAYSGPHSLFDYRCDGCFLLSERAKEGRSFGAGRGR